MKESLKSERPAVGGLMMGKAGIFAMALSMALLVVGCKQGASTAGQEGHEPSVEVITLTYTNYQGFEELVGSTESPATVSFRAQVTGYLEKVPSKEGVLVQSNDLLFTIDTARYQAMCDAAEAQVRRDQASLDKAKADLVRGKELLKNEVISAAQYDVYDATEKEAAASLALSKARLESANVDLKHTQIKAPYNGLMGEVLVRPGNLVSADSTQLGTMSVVDPMWVSFQLSEAAYLKSTQNGDFELAYKHLEGLVADKPDDSSTNMSRAVGDIELLMLDGSRYSETGRIFFLDRAFSQTTGTLKAKATVPNPKGYLKANQFVRLRIPMEHLTNVFVIPASALLQLQSISMVYVVGSDNIAQMRPITPIARANNEVVVRDGLKPGEKIVVKGLLKLRNGVKVNPVPTEEAEAHAKELAAEAEKKIQEKKDKEKEAQEKEKGHKK